MATNTPAHVPNIRRYAVANNAETQIDFEGTVAIVGFSIQCVDNINIRFSFDGAGTLSTNNYWTLKGGDVWIERDINWIHARNLYCRSEGANTYVEVIYWG